MKKLFAAVILGIGLLFGTQSAEAQDRYRQQTQTYRYECRVVETRYGRLVRHCAYYPVYRNYGQYRRNQNRNRRDYGYERYWNRQYRRYEYRPRFSISLNF
jgi:hypothetical protein